MSENQKLKMSERKGTKALELWCKRLIKDCPDIQIENMTTSWRDGMAFCALVHHFRPDLIDMSKLKHENIYDNNQLAFSVAEKYLGIPALLDPEDMVENDVPDRLSILTYLSQFYQRLGHTVTNKVSECDSKTTKTASDTAQPSAPIKFGKTGLDKCTACGLPVYLAQRLMVSHKLYHRRCFRCSKCSGHLNPKNYHIIEGSEFSCDSCKNDKTLLTYLNNNDHEQMGMLAFGDNLPDAKDDVPTEDVLSSKQNPRPTSILDKINMFEKNTDKDVNSKVVNMYLKDNLYRYKDQSSTSGIQSETDSKEVSLNESAKMQSTLHKDIDSTEVRDKMNESSLLNESSLYQNIPEKVYKSNIEKFNFLQTQLSDSIDVNKTEELDYNETAHKEKESTNEIENNDKKPKIQEVKDCSVNEVKEDCNITDDIRIAKIPTIISLNIDKEPVEELGKIAPEIKISVPPRRKKQITSKEKTKANGKTVLNPPKEYPDHLNPFSDDEDEEPLSSQQASTNPFGSGDEEDDDVPPIQTTPKVPGVNTSTPIKRLIAVNPFWSDGEEPSSDEEDVHNKSSKSTYSSMAASTPNLPSGTPRRVKAKAPPPPRAATVTDTSLNTSMDDVASISSFSSYNSTFNTEQRTPTMKKKAPTPPDSLSTVSEGGSLDKGADSSDMRNASGSECGKKAKGPAPGLPLPERREVKLQMSPEELQVQLDLLETQQLGLERQGVLIERMIRDKCEGDEACTAPQEEVEDLVIQLCELVNEKNDLFRKQTELMYIRRQQRLEQEQADIEHDIRIIQSRPAVNRIDADKAREELLVSRLVEIVRLRDELVQQLDAERRRERQEDLAIAASIASKRAQRNSDTTLKSADAATTHKKNKVKDKVKKQLKKAKHTLYSKKKDDSTERKECKDKTEK